MINLGQGTLYISELDGSYTPLGDISEINSCIDREDEQQLYINKIGLENLETSFEVITKITKEAILAITGMRKIIIECCPNKRVVYLALYSRKKRTRQKNFHRAIKILENLP